MYLLSNLKIGIQHQKLQFSRHDENCLLSQLQKHVLPDLRLEDIVFYPKETITAVCECAGGEIRKDQENFTYIVESAKADSPGHDASTGIYAAWTKYSKRPEPQFGFSDTDYYAAVEALDSELMEAFGYHHPPPRID